MKRLSVFIMTILLTFAVTVPLVEAYERDEASTISGKVKRPDLELTDEQEALLKKKKAELEEKYLTNIDELTDDEKADALKKYKNELKAFIENELGIHFNHKPRKE
jgi:hypothetical protein